MAGTNSPRLDPQARAVLDRAAASGAPPLYALSIDDTRRVYRETRAALAPAPPPVAEVRELSIPGPAGPLRARFYRPDGANGTVPGIAYFHGGGFIYGDLDTHDTVCRGLCASTPGVVVSVDYRLAPEHGFPAAAEDAFAATQWIARNAASLGVDAGQVIVAGDSAGGNLAAVVALMARDGGGPPLAMQVLVYPTVDLAADTGSLARFAEGYLLTRKSIEWMRRTYLRDARDAGDWRASPLRARDLSKLPPAYIITAGFDPLLDEGGAYAERLTAAGVAVTYECFEGQVHGFIVMGGVIAAAHHAVYRIGQAIRSQVLRRTL